jgi:uncharacterized protein YlxW (UPF0749 family)
MSLLADLFAGKDLDPGYAEAAARGTVDGAAARRGRLFFATVLLGLLGAVSVIQLQRSEPVAQRQWEALTAQIHQRTRETRSLTAQTDRLRSQTDALRRAALASSAAGRRATAGLDRATAAAAGTEVRGPALVVTVDDAPPKGSTATDGGRIYDQDLQGLVNALWASGATAVGINGQRLTSTTAIRMAGDAILVDYRPLSEPYVVSAIGAARSAFTGSRSDQDLLAIKATYGIRFDIQTEGSVRLPAAVPPSLRYAQEDDH